MTLPRQQCPFIESDFLLAAYASGYFPMADSCYGEIRWYSPDPRAIIPLDSFTISRSLRQTLKKNIFQIRVNTAFEEVVQSCAQRNDTWISDEIIRSYMLLHHLGYAHSVEAWKNETLSGGLYGVAIGAAFFGESMFSRDRDASKVALVYLVEQLRKKKFELLDIQYITPHLARVGAREIERKKYLNLLRLAIGRKRTFVD